MHDRLVSKAAVVLEHVVGGRAGRGHDRSTDPREDTAYRRCGVVRQFMQVNPGFLGDHQDMPGTERPDIEECKHMLVLEDAVAGDLSRKDPGKDGFAGFTHGFFTSPEG